MSAKRIVRLFFLCASFIIGLGGVMLLIPRPAIAGIYDVNNETVYTEYWVDHDEFDGGCLADHQKWYIEPWHPSQECIKTLDFTMPNLATVTQVEIYLDLWRNHASQSARFSINGNPTIYAPNVGDDWSRTPYIATIPKSEFVQGTNTISFWDEAGGYHIHDVAFFVYGLSASNSGVADGALSGITVDNGYFDPYTTDITRTLLVDTNQLVLTATLTSSNADYIEFHAYYDGYDEDNDGDTTDWHNLGHNNRHPGGTNENALGGTINHIATVPVDHGAGVYTATWNLPHIVSQTGVQFKIRIVNDAGGNAQHVREAAGGDSASFTLVRNTPTAYFTIPGFQNSVLHHNDDAQYDDIITEYIDLPPDILDFDSAYIIGAYYNNLCLSVNDHNKFLVFPDIDPLLGTRWDLSIINDVNDGSNFTNLRTQLNPGQNKIEYIYFGDPRCKNNNNQVFGSFIENPGPMIVLTRNNPVETDDKDPYTWNHAPTRGETIVDADTNITVEILDGGVGLDLNNGITLTVQGSVIHSNLTVSGNSTNAKLVYNPSVDFPKGQTIPVIVEACDLNGNCVTDSYSFTTRPPVVPSTITTDDFNRCTYNTGVGTAWTLHDNDATLAIDGAERLLFTVDGGSVHDLWQNVDSVPRLMQDANDQDFDLIVKFDSLPTEAIQMQGILVEDQSRQKFIRFNFQYRSGNIEMYAFTFSNGVTAAPVTEVQQTITANVAGAESLYMWVKRIDFETWILSYSTDGANWVTPDPAFNFLFEVDKVGLFVGNYANNANNAPEYTAVVDYFLNTSDPFSPEEDANAFILPLNKVGEGTASVSPTCGQPATLTAVESTPGWSFDSWSGAYSGPELTVNNVNFSKGDVVTATFTRDEYTLDMNVSSVFHDGIPQVDVDGGAIVIDPNQSIFYWGDDVDITAVPELGWTFTGWEGALTGNSAAQTLNLTQSEVLTATFTQDKYDLNVSVVGDFGRVDLSSTDANGRDYYIYGDQVTLEAIKEDADWNFIGWSGDLSGSTNPIQISVSGEMNIVATFNDTFFLFLPMVISSP